MCDRSDAPGTGTRSDDTPLRGRAWLLPGIAIALAAGLFWLGLPRLIGAYYAIPCSDTLPRVWAGERVHTATLLACVPSLEARLRWDDSRSAPADLGRVFQALADAPDTDTAQRRRFLALATGQIALAVSRAPQDTALWTRLAQLNWRLDQRVDATLSALRQATLTAPFEPTLGFARLSLWFQVLAAGVDLDANDRALLDRQIGIAADLDLPRLRRIAASQGVAERVADTLRDQGRSPDQSPVPQDGR